MPSDLNLTFPGIDSQLTECRRVAMLEARRRGLSQEDAEDISGDTVVSLILAVADGRQIRNVGGWSRVAAARLILNRHRDDHRAKRGGGNLHSLDALIDAGLEV
jgi:DNA-directed RNA polymerase specialized sigma24 family protein